MTAPSVMRFSVKIGVGVSAGRGWSKGRGTVGSSILRRDTST